MEFKTPKLEDKKMFDAYFDKINYRSADFSAATLILWKDHNRGYADHPVKRRRRVHVQLSHRRRG